ncbi:MAG: CvpA family protein [Calditrichia bacterium]|nr:CvpA family protein [Calditrichia bacterium]
MTFISLAIVIFVFFFVIKGLLKGLIAEVLGMASVILSVIIGLIFFESFAKTLNKFITFIPYYLLPLVSLLVLLAVSYISGILIIKLLTKMVDSLSLSWLNRLLGGCIGFLKGALFVSLIILILSFVLPKPLYSDVKKKHIAVNWFEPILPEIYEIIKQKDFKLTSPDAIKKWYKEMDKKSQEIFDEKINGNKMEENKENDDGTG